MFVYYIFPLSLRKGKSNTEGSCSRHPIELMETCIGGKTQLLPVTIQTGAACRLPLSRAGVARWGRKKGRPFRGNHLSDTTCLTHIFFNSCESYRKFG